MESLQTHGSMCSRTFLHVLARRDRQNHHLGGFALKTALKI
ncbi:hypothetical protein SynA15127_01025 [Synechococcus sp. A15-127]|nr:hypothetical protein SynA15127_01025 [Synechococcus sp. A15-127]